MATSKIVTLWQSDDGKEYRSEVEALRADVSYWKPYGERFLMWQKRENEARKDRERCEDRGGHQ